jgi:hypothetical protein
VADAYIDGAADFHTYRKSLGADLIYLHYYRVENKLIVNKRCNTSGWDTAFWAGIMHAKRSRVLKILSSTKVVQSFYEHCQHKLNDLVAYYNGDVFNVRVLDGDREIANTEAVYGIKNMQRQVAEFLGEYHLDADSVSPDLSATVFSRQSQ